jgi:hypothetical protein
MMALLNIGGDIIGVNESRPLGVVPERATCGR